MARIPRAVAKTVTEAEVMDASIVAACPVKSAPNGLPTLGPMLAPALRRARRRAHGIEKPIPLPWPSIAEQLGGGFWPGLHVLNAGTGKGKTQLGLEVGKHAACAGIPVAYVGLELGPDEIAMREMGLAAEVPWHALFTGRAGPQYLDAAEASIAELEGLPIHPYFGDPMGWPASHIADIGRKMRAAYPETDGPGSRPLLIVVDFLQLMGDEPDESRELRERIARATYQGRAVARDQSIAILMISSIARDKYDLGGAAQRAGMLYDEDLGGAPVKRRIRSPDALVGVGKESGEIEFSADSVSVLFAVPETEDEDGVDMVFATAKGRAVRTSWSVLHFNGARFREAPDGGARVVEAWKEAEDEKEQKREAKREAKGQAKVTKLVADAAAVATFVLAHPDCGVAEARVNAVGNDSARWSAAKAKLAKALVERDGKRNAKHLAIDLSHLSPDVRELTKVTP